MNKKNINLKPLNLNELIKKYEKKLEFIKRAKSKTSYELLRINFSEKQLIIEEILSDLERLKEIIGE